MNIVNDFANTYTNYSKMKNNLAEGIIYPNLHDCILQKQVVPICRMGQSSTNIVVLLSPVTKDLPYT